MAEASILSLKPKRKDINKYSELDEKWYSLGVELDVEDDELDNLEKYSDPHKRLIKMFVMWLETGENPTYTKLIQALVNIDKKDVAQSVCTDLGLTSSLDNLLNTTSQAKLSDCSSISIGQTEEVATKPSPIEPAIGQTIAPSESFSPSSNLFHIQTSEGDIPDKTNSTHDSRSIDKSTSTAPSDSETYSRESSRTELYLLSSDITVKDQMYDPIMTSPSADASAEPAYKAMIRCHDKLVTALSTDIITISGVLIAKEFIPTEISSKMLLTNLTPQEKGTILVNAVTDKLKIAPKRFDELIKIFREQTCTKDIVSSLTFQVRHEQDVEDDTLDCNTEANYSSQQYAVCEGHMYTPWASLSPDDKIDLEARLIDDAEAIREEFALLCWRVRDSFEERNIKPLTLASALLDLTVSEESSSGIPFLKEKEGALMRAKSVHDIFHVLRPHMNFFNYEILQFLVKGKGSKEDKMALSVFLKNFEEFCKRHVFELPFAVYSNGESSDNPKTQQRLHVKVTKLFKAALLTPSTFKSVPLASDSTQVEKKCSNKLGINLEDAKNIQRKLAKILKLKPSSLVLECISEGSIILTFLLPTCVSLAGLDFNIEIALLSFSGILILCGPPGKPELKELTSNGLVVQWSKPEYGCSSLAKYMLYYQKKCNKTNEWQKLELSSLETHACVPDLSDGDTYVFKICAVSDVGTLQYSDQSDPIVISADEILTNNVHEVIVANKDTITSALLSADPNTITVILSIKGVISKEDVAQIGLASTPNEKATLLITAIENQVKIAPEKFLNFLNSLSEAKLSDSLPGDVMETLWSGYYDSMYKQYLNYLKFLYASLDMKQTSSYQWPPSATKKFFRLAMIKTTKIKRGYIDDRFVRMTITGKVDDILLDKYPIQLEDIFKETECQRQVTKETTGQRKVILLDGAPGCGKSTLSVYICQQWEKGQLFNQFKLVILVPLRDPAVKNAKGLADLLPCPDTATAQQVAARMLTNKCRDVLFVLDGWDELPPNLRKNSIFQQLVQPNLSRSNPLFNESTVIVTSRPIASGDLHQVVSSRVEILGFTTEELHQFFTECLKGDTEAVKTLLERIEENPEVAGSCYLPLNATILVHLFKSDHNSLPTTLYGIFSTLVLNCIKRHLKLRLQDKNVSIETLDQLPEFAMKPFSVLCQLAYSGVMEDKIIFTSLPDDVNTLGLLQGVESFIGREKAVSHNFLHLSIQELLAAWYMATQLPASEQVSKFNELLKKSRFSAVFRFYAAITKLRTPGIKDVVINVLKKYSSTNTLEYNTPKKNIVLMVSLLHCLYEAQDPSLCESVAQKLQYGLILSGTTLTPSDCLCIGYFLSHVCKMATGEFNVYLSRCGIGDLGCNYLVSGLHKYLDSHNTVTTLLHISVESNVISHHGLHHLSTLLKIVNVNYLDLDGNYLESKQDHHKIHGTLAKQLKNNTTLKQLWLSGCGLNSQSAKSLAEALTTNKYLERLSVSNNALCDDGIQYIAYALRVNQGLKDLFLESCGMTNVGLECLAKSLQHNNVLTELSIWNVYNAKYPNRVTKKVVPVLTEFLQNNHALTHLELPGSLESSRSSIEKAVKDVRKRSGLPLIQVLAERNPYY